MPALNAASAQAARWVEAARADERARPLVEQCSSSSRSTARQGKALMSLAEALLRTPDPEARRPAHRRAPGHHAPAARVPEDSGGLLLRTGFALLGAARRLLPDVTAELSGRVHRRDPHRAAGGPGGARRAARSRCRSWRTPSSSARRSTRRSRAGAASRILRCAPSTCWARARAPRAMRSVTSTPTRTAIEALGTQAAGVDRTRARGSR